MIFIIYFGVEKSLANGEQKRNMGIGRKSEQWEQILEIYANAGIEGHNGF